MTPFVWMFIKNYENLRKFIINNKSISSLVQLEYSAFSEATVPICTFVLSNFDENYAGTYLKLSEFTGGMDVQKEKVLQIINGDKTLNEKNKFSTMKTNFNKIIGAPIAYWVTDDLYESFIKGTNLKSIANVKVGLQTGNNDKFLKFWHEINISDFNINNDLNKSYKWFPYNKGGDYRKWYGNQDYVVNWKDNGYEIRNLFNSNGKLKSRPQNMQYYFKKSITWSRISSSYFGVRFSPQGFIFDVNSPSLFIPKKYYLYIGGLLCSKLSTILLSILNPTISFQAGNINTIPIIIDDSKLDLINNIVKENILLCKNDWDDYETSWNFKFHPLIKFGKNLKESYSNWINYKHENFNHLKNNEIELNNIFAEIYSVLIDTEIEDKFITINKANYKTDIKSFISYAIGCMFGRYSLDNEGLQFAGGNFDLNIYHRFIPDDDNIIPVLDTAYFDDDIVGYFTKFVETCFGKKTLEENLDFIAGALSKSKKPSREIIRQYLLKNFFNDHKKTYKKCPIYWQFSSGKHNGFNCLVYMHRYEPSLVARIRTDYLHKTQKAIEQRIANNDNIINNSTSKQEVANATKEKTKLQKQLKETQEYDEVLAHIANQNIKIDLDDGVKVNYAKFQNIEIKKEGSKTKKVNLLKKI